MNIFTDEFIEYPIQEVHRELEEHGFFCFENAFTTNFIHAIFESVEANRFGLNTNWVSGVCTEQQYYLTHMLAVSKEFYDYVTHQKIRDISRKILGDRIRLKAMRYYETLGGHHMQWHTDNKTDKGFAHIPGIIFIAYLVDVDDGEFQYISGSHDWSGIQAYSDYSDEEIKEKYEDRIISFRKPAGSLIIYNTYGIHRAKPFRSKGYVRKSLFFQVDSEITNAEPLLLNPAFCTNLTDDVREYLGFGLGSNYQIFPNSKLKDHPVTMPILKEVAGWLGYRLIRNQLRSLSPEWKSSLKRLLKK